MTTWERVKATPRCDWPVADRELSGVGNFVGLYGGEHIAATEFVIGATLVQYGCSASDILIGLAIGNILAVLTFTFLCATIATDTRLTLYTYLYRILGKKMQKVYNLVWGIGFSALGAAGICISATAIRRVLNVPIQHEWYPTSIKFVLIVVVLGTVITIIAAKGFEAVAKFASTCVPWMIVLFFLGIIVTLPQLLEATGFGPVRSPGDLMRLLNEHVWVAQPVADGQKLGIIHVIGFAWTCNVAWHFALNDMSLLRFAKNYKYGFTSAVGMFIGHFFAWLSAGIMGATASILLSTPLANLDSGEVTYAVLGYSGLLAVVIAGWTTANPTFYRVTLSLNAIFKKFSHKQVTYIAGFFITLAACFPIVQRAADILTFLGLAVEGVGAICITEHYIFPKIGYTRYWNLYRKKDINWAATISWGISILFVIILIFTRPFHQNFWFIPNYLISMVSYIILAGLMGAKEKYPEEEAEEMEYEEALQRYVNNLLPEETEKPVPTSAKILRILAFADLAVLVILGIVCSLGNMDLDLFKGVAFGLSLVYFLCNGISMVMIYRKESEIDERTAKEILESEYGIK